VCMCLCVCVLVGVFCDEPSRAIRRLNVEEAVGGD
jgi:hypothetical protein